MENGQPKNENEPPEDSAEEKSSPFSHGFVPPSIEELGKLLPNYKFIEFVDKGGMGAVYKAIQPGLSRTVAVKLLPPDVGKELAFEKRFRREAQTMAKLSHPNIVSVYDFGETSEGHLYFVMEFIEGSDLRHLIREGELKPEQILPIINQVCDALQYAHDNGVIHRDVKPANILIDKSGVVKVADFGLAKPGDASAEASMISIAGFSVGTPSYMAPEALEEGDIDHRADIYSLGVVIYEMLTGTTPKGAWEPPSKCAGADMRFDEVVHRAMQANRDERFQKATEVSHAFDTDSFVWRQHPNPPRRFSIWIPTAFLLSVVVLLAAWFLLYTPEGRQFDFFGLVSRAPEPLTAEEFERVSREMAGWVFSKGGYVQLRSMDKYTSIYSESELPEGVFEIWRVSMEHQSEFNDKDLERLVDYCARLPNVRNLNFKYTSISPAGLAELLRISENLRGLNIANTLASSDDSIADLLKFERLGVLLIRQPERGDSSEFSELSEQGVERLRRGLPETIVRLAEL